MSKKYTDDQIRAQLHPKLPETTVSPSLTEAEVKAMLVPSTPEEATKKPSKMKISGDDWAKHRAKDEAAKVVPKLNGFTARQLDEMDLPEPTYVINRCGPVGSRLIIAKPKDGKTTMSVGCGYAISTGGKVFGELSVDQGDVLLLLYEDNKRRFKKRLRQIAGDVPMPENMTIVFRDKDSRRLGNGLLEQIREWHASVKRPRYVVIDTLAAVRPVIRGRDPRSVYQAEYDTLVAITELAHELGILIDIIHHTRKMRSDDFIDDVSGTAGSTGAVDTVCMLRRATNGGFEFIGRGRDVEDFEFGLIRDGARFLKVGSALELRLSGQKREIMRVLKANAGAEGMKPAEVSALVQGLDGKRASQLLTEMAEKNEGVIKLDRGKYKAAPEQVDPSDQPDELGQY